MERKAKKENVTTTKSHENQIKSFLLVFFLPFYVQMAPWMVKKRSWINEHGSSSNLSQKLISRSLFTHFLCAYVCALQSVIMPCTNCKCYHVILFRHSLHFIEEFYHKITQTTQNYLIIEHNRISFRFRFTWKTQIDFVSYIWSYHLNKYQQQSKQKTQ